MDYSFFVGLMATIAGVVVLVAIIWLLSRKLHSESIADSYDCYTGMGVPGMLDKSIYPLELRSCDPDYPPIVGPMCDYFPVDMFSPSLTSHAEWVECAYCGSRIECGVVKCVNCGASVGN